MAQLANVPKQQTTLRLAARKSFSFGLLVTDRNGTAVDVTGTTFRLVSKKPPFDLEDNDDGDNLILNSTATPVFAEGGLVRFDLQASDLDHPFGEYPFAIVMNDEGYTSVIVNGPLEIVENPEMTSETISYDPEELASTLQVFLHNRDVIKVQTGPTLLPGQVPFTEEDEAKLDALILEAQLPPDGVRGEVLSKLSDADYDADWAVVVGEDEIVDMIEDPDDPGFFIPDDETVALEDDPDDEGTFTLGRASLDATGVPAGRVPVALGNDLWSWDELDTTVATLDDVADSETRLAMTPEERSQLLAIPDFGTAALEDVEAFEAAGAPVDAARITTGVIDDDRIPLVSALRGWTHGTGAPTGPPGTIYLKHS